MGKHWVGVDLDGTLAIYDTWQGPAHIGAAIPKSVEFVKALLNAGMTVKILTARVCSRTPPEDLAVAIKAINAFCMEQFGRTLEITAEKDWDLMEFYDDRAITVEYNQGIEVPQWDR